ncbi:MAG: hypothetical protein QM726_05900 [Chitinophagaceae bacterium]
MRKTKKDISNILNIPDLICCWDFNAAHPYISRSEYAYELLEGNGKSEIKQGGIIGDTSIDIKEGQYLFIPRNKCAALNIHGKDAQVTVLAWLKRQTKSVSQCEAVAGMWNETEKQRQYCLFLNLQLFESGDQVCGHISSVGGPTPGQRWCIDASIGEHKVNYNEWNFVAFTYDGFNIKSYLNGKLDERAGRNPYHYDTGIFDGKESGSDFTVAAVHRSNEMGNDFVGQLSGLAVFKRALTDKEIMKLHKDFPLTEG